MLYFIFVWLLFGAACFILGTALLNLIHVRCFESNKDYFNIAVWIGIVAFSLLFLSLALWIPLSTFVGSAVAACLTLLSLTSQETRQTVADFSRQLSPGLIFGFFSLGLAVAAFTTQQIVWFDTGLYHIGAIKWLSEFGSVPGVALIHHRFGFTSAWFALAAPLTPQFLGNRIGAITNGFIFFIFTWHFLLTLTQITRRKLADWFIIISSSLIIPALIVKGVTGSPLLISFSPDVSIILLVIVVAWTILVNRTDAARVKSDNAQIVPVILATGAVAIKLTALPLLLLAVLFYIFQGFAEISSGFEQLQELAKRSLAVSLLLILLLSPVAVSGIVTSGCPLFPSTFMCLDLPWTLPEQIVNTEAQHVRGQEASGETLLDYLTWLWQQWFYYSNSQLIVGLLVFSILAATLLLLKSGQRKNQGQIWVAAIGVLGTIFIVIKAPWIRFVFGYAILVPSLVLANWCHNAKRPLLRFPLLSMFLHQLLFRFGGVFLVGFAVAVLIHGKIQSRLLLPAELPRPQVVQSTVNDVNYVYPDNWYVRCWATELPCAELPKINIKLRNTRQGIGAGFVRAE